MKKTDPIKRLVYALVVLNTLPFLLVRQAFAQEPSTKVTRKNLSLSSKRQASSGVEDGITREQGDAILAELREIHELLQKQGSQDRFLFVPKDQANSNPNGDEVQLSFGKHWPSLGREDAPLVLLEFTDYQCPYCRAFQAEIFPQMKKGYVDTGKVRYISLDLPLPQHAEAAAAAEAARCAGDQNKYWEFRGAILSDQRAPSEDVVLEAAHLLSLDAERFRRCLSMQTHRGEVEEDLADAAFLRINGTPTFVLGKTSQGKLQGTLLSGVMPYPVLQAKIDEILRGNRP